MSTLDIVTLADVKSYLKIGSTTYDTELALYITAASTMWVQKVGPVAGSPSYTEWYDGGETRIVLRHTPVQSVTAVEETFGSTYVRALTQQDPDSGSGSAFDFSFDAATGTLTRRAVGVAMPFANGQRNIKVTYTAGYAAIPADIVHAVKLLVAHLWETQRGNMPLPGQPGPDGWTPSQGYTWPRRVLEIAQGYYVPGIA